jgi:O-antigen/teichoic acid export membrane protein
LKTDLFPTAGKAIFWQTIQYGGEKAIFLVRLIVLANLLTPLDFGLLAIASLAIDVLMRLSNFGMTTALVQLDNASQDHYDSAWTLDLLRALAITLIVYVAAPFIVDLVREPRVVNILRVLAMRPIIDAAASIMIARFSRNLNFRALVFLQLPKALTNTILSIALARWLGVWALVVGTLAGSLVFLMQSYLLAPHRPRLIFHPESIHPLARFGRWVFLTSIVVMLSQTSLRVVISRQLGAAELGLYYLAASLAFMPTDIANQVVGAVAFPFSSRLQNDFQQATLAFKSILMSVTVLLLPISVLMLAMAPSLVNDVLGPNWAGTINIIRILAVINILDVLGETISPILNGTGHPNKILVMESVQSVTLISVVSSLTGAYGAAGAALAWFPATMAAQMLGLFFLHRLLIKPFSGLQAPLVTVGMISITGALCAMGIDALIPGWPGFIVASTAGVLLMGGLLWLFERRFSLGLLDGFQRAFPPLASWMGLKSRYET